MNNPLILFFILFFCSVNISSAMTPALRFSVGEGHPMIPLAEQVLQIAYQKMGINIEVIELPGGRANSEMRYGEIDGELFRGINLERVATNAIRIPIPIATGEMVVFSTNKDIKVNGWESLKGYRIGGLIRLKDTTPNDLGLQMTYIKTPELLFKMLERGRVEVVIAPRRLGEFFIAKMGLTNIVRLEPPIRKDHLYHYLSNKHAHLVPELIQILKLMQKSGEFELITRQAEINMYKQIKILNLPNALAE